MDRHLKKALDEKKIVTCGALLIYPDFNKHFGIYTDDIDFLVVAVISQDCKPIDLYIRKLTQPQTQYTIT